jgi:hypothetical protein
VIVCPRRTDTALNLGECPLHRGARQIKLHGKFAKGCVGGTRPSAGDPGMQAVSLQKILL